MKNENPNQARNTDLTTKDLGTTATPERVNPLLEMIRQDPGIKVLRHSFVPAPDIIPEVNEKKQISETLTNAFDLADFLVCTTYDFQETVLNYVNGVKDERDYMVSVLEKAKEAFHIHFDADLDFLIACLKALPTQKASATESISGNNSKEGSAQGEHTV